MAQGPTVENLHKLREACLREVVALERYLLSTPPSGKLLDEATGIAASGFNKRLLLQELIDTALNIGTIAAPAAAPVDFKTAALDSRKWTWGFNGHITWAAPYAKATWAYQVLKLLELGATQYRNAYAWTEDASGAITGSDANTFKDFIDNYATPAGILVHPVLMATYSHASLTTEAKAYTFGYNRGVEAATALKGRVVRYELGNELEVWGLLSNQGAWWQDYDNTKFTIQRGMICGMADGIRATDPTARIMSPGGTWMHTAFYDNLFMGRSPDGSTGHQVLVVDEISWHHYLDQWAPNDNPELMSDQGNFNLFGHLASWGKPIHITECGVRASKYGNDETAIAAAIVGQYALSTYWNVRKTYGIVGAMPYQLIDAAPNGAPADELAFGALASDTTTRKLRFNAYRDFIKSHQLI
ncbi:hypothetical protein X534_gp50 [Ralstonia phage RSB3]|uniref:Uncharacterized protein n=1 Tax=Ralstonia phage RSB3 TaxID=1402875 RepID=U3TJ01_9CAUD|nr:hypothetical protein X534_gp50 [Ralstonia phage RSB3]BAN92361.1 hypothetical protein [Ralstonia phage RSB3]